MISFELNDGIGIIQLAINDKNSFSNDSFLALKQSIKEAKDSKAKVVVLRSTSPGSFSLGLDLTTVSSMDMSKDLAPFLELFYNNLTEIYQLPMPTIAEVSGHALGYGAMLALVCDYRFATSDIRFGLPEVKIGIQVPSFVYALMGEAVGYDLAKRHVLLGDAFKAKEYPTLFEEISETEDDLKKKSKSLQTKLKKNSYSAMKDTKKGILSVHKPLLDLVSEDVKNTIASIQSPDAKEGISASVEVRRPVFTS
ncbi:enoyl-CoA hydratase/isomerase family protein [Leptospira levettii]|uniref:enoyl-CoA hydratase/isomerase family protein n=1 Tax=Leptospira levettii TaxID=2023178 RepID=UPI0010843010|nr:enoyl-CoA hydratase/isomerase family protein [Leptospira levettii]MCW7509030.1 enoyl-CoA hydratase/isomerase family protein [Leptospira levettii]MCW7520119.1 enoyl-CoA hydratase/isomerase family protein [Leptospira levettii]TGK97622.1 enoyl-CoA hydratase/isomerase family protein [Leptospira levettii]